jgi:hypothetical protein
LSTANFIIFKLKTYNPSLTTSLTILCYFLFIKLKV